MKQKHALAQLRFSESLGWALFVVVALFLLPVPQKIITLIQDQIDRPDTAKRLAESFQRLHRDVLAVLDQAPTNQVVRFPDCLFQIGLTERERTLTSFRNVPDLRAARPNTVLCESARAFGASHLALLLDGRVVLIDAQGAPKAFPPR